MLFLKKFGAALLLAALTFPAFATPTVDVSPADAKVKTKAVEQKSIAVQLYNLGEEATTLEVESRDGTLYYQKRIKGQNGFGIVLNLESLPEGAYMLSVNRKEGVQTQIFRITEEGVLLSQIVERE